MHRIRYNDHPLLATVAQIPKSEMGEVAPSPLKSNKVPGSSSPYCNFWNEGGWTVFGGPMSRVEEGQGPAAQEEVPAANLSQASAAPLLYSVYNKSCPDYLLAYARSSCRFKP